MTTPSTIPECHREPSSYFSFSHPRKGSSSSGSPVSPRTSPGRPIPLLAQRPSIHRTSGDRAVSDQNAIQPRVIVQTIDEGVVSNELSPTRSAAFSQSRATRHQSSEPRASTASGPRSEPPSPSPGLPFRARPGRRWSRTRSGSVWYERLKGSSGQSKQSSDPSQDSSRPKPVITPLTPPAPVSGTRRESVRHQVKVEKSFTSLRVGRMSNAGTHHSLMTPMSTSRRSSTNPLRLFSAPLVLLRKFSLPKRRAQLETQAASKSTTMIPASPCGEMRGHKSLLKRTHTSDALSQVTSILHETVPLSATCAPITVVKSLDSRQLSDRSGSSKGSGEPRNPRAQPKKGTVLTSPMLSRRSTHDLLEEPISWTTSQWELKMGAPPGNTPDEKTTYKIKRSPSAETEEFFKVDISIRGGTSYLPSEARRIHTPPLLHEGLDGKRRGFFFDYNAPRSPESRAASFSNPRRPRHSLPSDLGTVPHRSTSRTTTIHKCTFMPSPCTNGKKRPTRLTTGDWYDVKLAELDTSDDEAPCSHIERPKLGRERSATTKSGTSLAEIKQKREEEEIDYNIPEHLPGSPLCPRSQKYWRVVQGRGSQFRGCWTHGVGKRWEEWRFDGYGDVDMDYAAGQDHL